MLNKQVVKNVVKMQKEGIDLTKLLKEIGRGSNISRLLTGVAEAHWLKACWLTLKRASCVALAG